MQYQFVGKNIEVTEAIKTFTAEKFKTLEKRYPNIALINVVFHVEHITQIAEATLVFNGAEMHATAKNADMYQAIEDLADKLLTQITKHKEKVIDSHRGNAS